jgi:hypothetical protein
MKDGSNPLLTASAAAYFLAGVPLLFAPREICELAGGACAEGQQLTLQALGAAFLGFAMLNWTNRFSRVGGILGRPLLVANLSHTATAFLLLVRPAFASGSKPLLAASAAYLALAVAFGSRLFVAPRETG